MCVCVSMCVCKCVCVTYVCLNCLLLCICVYEPKHDMFLYVVGLLKVGKKSAILI